MLKIYGSDLCPDCIQCKAELDAAGVSYEYMSITEDLRNMKAFLKLRETRPEFAPVREGESIGIPCILTEEGDLTFDWSGLL